MYKCVRGKAPNYLSDRLTFIRDLHDHDTRNEHLVQLTPSRTNAMKRSFTYTGAMLWNMLPHACHTANNEQAFKNDLRFSILQFFN